MYIVSLDLNLNSIFSKLEPNIKNEIFNYIEFLKKKPLKQEFLLYKISEESLSCFLHAINTLLKNIK